MPVRQPTNQLPSADSNPQRPGAVRTAAQLLAAGLGLFCSVATSYIEPCEESTQVLAWDEEARSGLSPRAMLDRAQAHEVLALVWDGSGLYDEADLGLELPDTQLSFEITAEEEGGRDMSRSGDCGSDIDGLESRVVVRAQSADGAIDFHAAADLFESPIDAGVVTLRPQMDAFPDLDLSAIEPADAFVATWQLDIDFHDDGSVTGRLVASVHDADDIWLDDVHVATLSSL